MIFQSGDILKMLFVIMFVFFIHFFHLVLRIEASSFIPFIRVNRHSLLVTKALSAFVNTWLFTHKKKKIKIWQNWIAFRKVPLNLYFLSLELDRIIQKVIMSIKLIVSMNDFSFAAYIVEEKFQRKCKKLKQLVCSFIFINLAYN